MAYAYSTETVSVSIDLPDLVTIQRKDTVDWSCNPNELPKSMLVELIAAGLNQTCGDQVKKDANNPDKARVMKANAEQCQARFEQLKTGKWASKKSGLALPSYAKAAINALQGYFEANKLPWSKTSDAKNISTMQQHDAEKFKKVMEHYREQETAIANLLG